MSLYLAERFGAGALFVLFLVLSLVLFAGRVKAGDFVPQIYTAPDGKTLPYQFLVPANYDKSRKYPVILFLHGAGSRGADNRAQLKLGVLTFDTPENRTKFPCFVIAPQCPKGQQWVDMPWHATSGVRPPQPSAPMQLALDLLHRTCAQYSIDPSRIYVVGLSMGAYGAWDCVTRFPDYFAAAIIVAGGGDEKTITPKVAKVPVWVFHSADDPTVFVDRDRRMVQAMKDAGGHPRYTEYQGLGHKPWTTVFAEPELFPWLFAQKRG